MINPSEGTLGSFFIQFRGETGMKKVEDIILKALDEKRTVLLEHEVYDIFKVLGINTPDYVFIKKDSKFTDADTKINGERVVVKVVSPEILHKTELGGVIFCNNNSDDINKAIDTITKNTSSHNVNGCLVVEMVPYKPAFGREVIVSVRNSKDFGTLTGFGIGGLDTEFFGKNMNNAFSVISSEVVTHVLDKIRTNAAYYKLSGMDRAGKRLVSDDEITSVLNKLNELGKAFSYKNGNLVITECEINPIVVSEGGKKGLVAIDGLMKIEKDITVKAVPRPFEKLDKLFHPSSIAVIGVSDKGMNMGRIILNNIINKGFSKTNMYVIKPDTKEIDGVTCYARVEDLPKKVDLLVLAVSAQASGQVIKVAVEQDKFDSIIVIPGGFAEKEGGEKHEAEIVDIIKNSRHSKGKGPVIVGGNCLGVISYPGKYDTFFIPSKKMSYSEPLPYAFISQSGAFIISKVSKTGLTPKYAASIGNQMDLTFSDYLGYFKNSKDINTVAVYIEGFKELDGIKTAKAVKELVDSGKKVIVYKGGRSSAGKSAASGHTASIAGDYSVYRSVMHDAGAMIVESFTEFEDLLKLCVLWDRFKPNGKKVALLSNAGFEAVGMADNLSRLSLGKLNAGTITSMTKALKEAKIDTLVSASNPMDVTPSAGDKANIDCFRLMLEDNNVDVGVFSCIPMTPAIKSLVEELGPDSMFNMIKDLYSSTKKPFVVVVDSGELYDPACRSLKGIPVFRESDRAIRALEKFFEN
jgi:acyl-CoA synthetase (NDP forming)